MLAQSARRGHHPPMAKALMIQGTCSNAGKSLLVAGLARAFMRRGLRGASRTMESMAAA